MGSGSFTDSSVSSGFRDVIWLQWFKFYPVAPVSPVVQVVSSGSSGVVPVFPIVSSDYYGFKVSRLSSGSSVFLAVSTILVVSSCSSGCSSLYGSTVSSCFPWKRCSGVFRLGFSTYGQHFYPKT